MRMKRNIATTIHDYLRENSKYVDQILDKINYSGKHSLTPDEREYLNQYNKGLRKMVI